MNRIFFQNFLIGIKKSEIAPLFKPQTSMGWTFGMQNSTDFIKNRMNPSMKMNNIKPFEEIKVGPSIMRGDNNDTNNNENTKSMLINTPEDQ